MDYLQMEERIDYLVTYSKEHLNSNTILKSLDSRYYFTRYLFLAITYLTFIVFIFGTYISFNYANNNILIFSVALAIIVLIGYRYREEKSKYIKLKIQNIRLELLSNYVRDSGLNEDEVYVISKELEERGNKRYIHNLRLSAAFSILMLPIWDNIVNSVIKTNKNGIQIKIVLYITVLIAVILVILIIFLYIESRILVIINEASNRMLNISKLLNIAIAKEEVDYNDKE